MQKNKVIIIILIFIAVILVAGCTNTSSTQNQVTTTVRTPIPTTSPSSLTPIITVQTPAEPITTTTLLTINTTTTILPQTTQTMYKTENPYINNLQFRINFFTGHIHNCEMEEIFPTIAKDPYYGLKQKIPKISAISAGEFKTFLRDYSEGKNENQKVIGISRCVGATVTPYWNFIKTDATITPTNGNPTNYTVSINIRSQGKIIAQFNTTEKLTKDQIISFESYIPLKTEEMPFVDSVELAFTKLPN